MPVSLWFLPLIDTAELKWSGATTVTTTVLLLHSALSTIALTLNNASGHCAEDPPPPPHPSYLSHSGTYQQISACSATVKRNYYNFYVYRANSINTINQFTQQQHPMFVFCCCSPKRMQILVELLPTTPPFSVSTNRVTQHPKLIIKMFR